MIYRPADLVPAYLASIFLLILPPDDEAPGTLLSFLFLDMPFLPWDFHTHSAASARCKGVMEVGEIEQSVKEICEWDRVLSTCFVERIPTPPWGIQVLVIFYSMFIFLYNKYRSCCTKNKKTASNMYQGGFNGDQEVS